MTVLSPPAPPPAPPVRGETLDHMLDVYGRLLRVWLDLRDGMGSLGDPPVSEEAFTRSFGEACRRHEIAFVDTAARAATVPGYEPDTMERFRDALSRLDEGVTLGDPDMLLKGLASRGFYLLDDAHRDEPVPAVLYDIMRKDRDHWLAVAVADSQHWRDAHVDLLAWVRTVLGLGVSPLHREIEQGDL